MTLYLNAVTYRTRLSLVTGKHTPVDCCRPRGDLWNGDCSPLHIVVEMQGLAEEVHNACLDKKLCDLVAQVSEVIKLVRVFRVQPSLIRSREALEQAVEKVLSPPPDSTGAIDDLHGAQDGREKTHITKVTDALSVAAELPFLSHASLDCVLSSCTEALNHVDSGQTKETLDEVWEQTRCTFLYLDHYRDVD